MTKTAAPITAKTAAVTLIALLLPPAENVENSSPPSCSASSLKSSGQSSGLSATATHHVLCDGLPGDGAGGGSLGHGENDSAGRILDELEGLPRLLDGRVLGDGGLGEHHNAVVESGVLEGLGALEGVAVEGVVP